MTKWIKHDGQQCPLDDDTLVEIKLKNGDTTRGTVSSFRWTPSSFDGGYDIVKYRIVSEEPKDTPLATQVGGNHYKDLKIQPMEYSMANKLNACQHTVVKYITRYKDKNGKQDLLKAKHTIDLLIQMEYGDEE